MPLAKFPGHGPITTHLEGPHSHEKCHRVKVIVHTNPRTKLQCSQDSATVVQVNDTRTQCTTWRANCRWQGMRGDAIPYVKNYLICQVNCCTGLRGPFHLYLLIFCLQISEK